MEEMGKWGRVSFSLERDIACGSVVENETRPHFWALIKKVIASRSVTCDDLYPEAKHAWCLALPLHSYLSTWVGRQFKPISGVRPVLQSFTVRL